VEGFNNFAKAVWNHNFAVPARLWSDRQRSLDALQWGLIPYWAKDPKIAYRTINARAETVDKAPSFRQAFTKRRCQIPADGFYEWRKTAKPKNRKMRGKPQIPQRGGALGP
jgi:putative SOS response-associated peptidase YedK